MKESQWEHRFWKAYEWAHNNHHPNSHQAAEFATAYSNTGSHDSVAKFWDRWISGKIKPEEYNPEGGE